MSKIGGIYWYQNLKKVEVSWVVKKWSGQAPLMYGSSWRRCCYMKNFCFNTISNISQRNKKTTTNKYFLRVNADWRTLWWMKEDANTFVTCEVKTIHFMVSKLSYILIWNLLIFSFLMMLQFLKTDILSEVV